MRATLQLLGICCCLALCTLPLAAGEAPAAAPAEAAVEAPMSDATPSCPSLIAGLPDAVQLAPCMITVSCSDGSSVSCNGNSSCSTSGTNDRCVTCDGVQQGCCALTACEQCENSYNGCISTCEGTCHLCEKIYNFCVNNQCT
jgi:hypothetical protein